MQAVLYFRHLITEWGENNLTLINTCILCMLDIVNVPLVDNWYLHIGTYVYVRYVPYVRQAKGFFAYANGVPNKHLK